MALTDSTNPMQGVSGPGPYAKREDLAYKPDSYGDGIAMENLIKQEPLAKAEPTPKARASDVREAARQSITPIFADSQRPQEDIMVGTDSGPGEGSSILGMTKTPMKTSDMLAKLLPFDTDGSIAILYSEAKARGD